MAWEFHACFDWFLNKKCLSVNLELNINWNCWKSCKDTVNSCVCSILKSVNSYLIKDKYKVLSSVDSVTLQPLFTTTAMFILWQKTTEVSNKSLIFIWVWQCLAWKVKSLSVTNIALVVTVMLRLQSGCHGDMNWCW